MKIYKNISGLEFKVIEKLPNRVAVFQFLESGAIVKANISNASAGKVADPLHRKRLGIGYLGYYERTPYHKQALQLWSNMLKRCYDPNDKRGYYGKGVEVSESWQCFANFLKDIKELDNFENWLNKEKCNLDKDFLGNGKLYSKETCQFIPESVNKSAGKRGKRFVAGEWRLNE